MATGVILSLGGTFGKGATPFILGVTADHFSFEVGIFWLGVLDNPLFIDCENLS